MIRYLACILLSFLLLSCTSRTIYKKPEDLIPENQMVDLWTEILIANAAKTIKNKKVQRKVNYMPFIQEKYQIDSARFMRSNIYYTSKVNDYEKMFQKVDRRLQELKWKYDPESEGIDPNLPIWKRDSIKRARKKDRDTKENKEQRTNISEEDLQKMKIVD